MARILALRRAHRLRAASTAATPLSFARNAVAFSVHFNAWTIFQEEHRFLTRRHLRAAGSSIAVKIRALRARWGGLPVRSLDELQSGILWRSGGLRPGFGFVNALIRVQRERTDDDA